jgi:hypothetical protein
MRTYIRNESYNDPKLEANVAAFEYVMCLQCLMWIANLPNLYEIVMAVKLIRKGDNSSGDKYEVKN